MAQPTSSSSCTESVQEPFYRHTFSTLLLHFMASLAEMERELTVERMRAGLEVAWQLGRKDGRQRQMTESKTRSAKKLLISDILLNKRIAAPEFLADHDVQYSACLDSST